MCGGIWHDATEEAAMESIGCTEGHLQCLAYSREHTCAKKYKYAARENISNKKMGRKVIRLYLAVLMLFFAKPAILSAGTPPARLTVLESLTSLAFSSSSSVCIYAHVPH